VPIGPFADELHATFGAGVTFHEVYPASEGFIAVQDDEPAAGLRLLTDRGLYFEFLPLAHYDETSLDLCGDHIVPLAGAQPGVDYVILLTTPAGLVRYIIGDIVRFTSLKPPRLVYAGRTKLQLSAFGEHVIERELTEAFATVCRQHGVSAGNFHVAPLFPDPAQGRPVGRHEWWIELRGDGAPGPAPFAADLDRELATRNDDYAAKRAGHGLAPPTVRFLRAGVFETWLKSSGKWGGQSKTPRCRSDRHVAEQLATITEP
jgi:GH3 auxin-responsive promoter